MDVRCKHCGEPWDIDFFHDVAEEQGTTFDVIRKDFYKNGCQALDSSHGDMNYRNGEIISALQDVLGDDIDALAVEIEDYNL